MTLTSWHRTFLQWTYLIVFTFTVFVFGFTASCKAKPKSVKQPVTIAVRGSVTDTTFSPDSAFALVVARVTDEARTAGVAQLYYARTGKLTRAFGVANSDAVAAAISPDGAKVATGHIDGTVCVWDTNTRRYLAGRTRW